LPVLALSTRQGLSGIDAKSAAKPRRSRAHGDLSQARLPMVSIIIGEAARRPVAIATAIAC